MVVMRRVFWSVAFLVCVSSSAFSNNSLEDDWTELNIGKKAPSYNFPTTGIQDIKYGIFEKGKDAVSHTGQAAAGFAGAVKNTSSGLTNVGLGTFKVVRGVGYGGVAIATLFRESTPESTQGYAAASYASSAKQDIYEGSSSLWSGLKSLGRGLQQTAYSVKDSGQALVSFGYGAGNVAKGTCKTVKQAADYAYGKFADTYGSYGYNFAL